MDVRTLSGPMLAAQYGVAVARKALDSVEIQGQQSLQLIQAAAPPPNVQPGVGQRVNVVG